MTATAITRRLPTTPKTNNFLHVPKILILLVFVTLSAWSILVYQHWQMSSLPMAEMWMPPVSTRLWTIADFTVVYLMWAVMMAAMMLPSVIPMIKAFNKACQQHYATHTPYSYLFSFAYFLVWLFFSIILTLLQWQLHGLHWLSNMMESTNTSFAATLFITAGIYQFTPLKHACLKHCRLPISFLLNNWQNGRLGALNMGLIHGSTCLGCCWAQMLLMFAVGVMSITGMVLLTLFILLEKTLPANEHLVSQLAGALLCCWGIVLLLF